MLHRQNKREIVEKSRKMRTKMFAFYHACAYDDCKRRQQEEVCMLNFDEELKKFKPCLEVKDIEEAVYQEDLTDMTDILKEVMQQK